MRAVTYPADVFGCGHHRLIWPAAALTRAGHSVAVVEPNDRALRVWMHPDGLRAAQVEYPAGVDVMVFQRVTHAWVAAAIPWLRSRGVACVVDIDDDLAAIHPANPAWTAMHPRNNSPHSWLHLARACRDATLVTVSTPALAQRYGPHGRVRVLPNVLAGHYYGHPHPDSDWLGWPGTIQSHPDDPQATGGAVRRLVDQGVRFRVIGDPTGSGRAFGLEADPPGTGNVDLEDWPRVIAAGIGVGLVPLSNTRFNAAKSHLKGLELAAAGVPFVASSTPEYRRLHRMGAGLLAASGRDWFRQLRHLLGDAQARVELAEQGRAVAAELSLERHAWRWWEAWADAVALERGRGPLRPPPPTTTGPPPPQVLAAMAQLRARDNSAQGLLRRA